MLLGAKATNNKNDFKISNPRMTTNICFYLMRNRNEIRFKIAADTTTITTTTTQAQNFAIFRFLAIETELRYKNVTTL